MIASLKSSKVTFAATWPRALSISRQALTDCTVLPPTVSPVRITASAAAFGPVNTPELKSSRSAWNATRPRSLSEGPLKPNDE